MYTVKQLADLAGVSARTLHHYDNIGLLKPAEIAENGYRHYGEQEILRLQQILFFREMDFNLNDIAEMIDRPDFDVMGAMKMHKKALQDEIDRLSRLIGTLDKTMMNMKGKVEMSNEEKFEGFSEEKQKQYEAEARKLWGDEEVGKSVNLWNSYSDEKKKAIQAESSAALVVIRDNMDKGIESPQVQEQVAALHRNVEYFYRCSYERFRGLGQMYKDSPDFAAFYQKVHPDMPEFLSAAIQHYTDGKTGYLDESTVELI